MNTRCLGTNKAATACSRDRLPGTLTERGRGCETLGLVLFLSCPSPKICTCLLSGPSYINTSIFAAMDPFSAEGGKYKALNRGENETNCLTTELLNIHNSFHQGQYQEVIDFDTSKLSPDNTIPAQVLKWRAQIANGQAKSVIDKLAKGNDSPDTAAVKAFALYTLGKSTEAQEGAEKLAATSADNATVQLMAGTVLQAVGKPEEALTLLSKHQGSLEA